MATVIHDNGTSTVALDENGLQVRTHTRKLMFDKPMPAVDSSMMEMMRVPIGPGFLRTGINASLSADGRVFRFVIVDQEIDLKLNARLNDSLAH